MLLLDDPRWGQLSHAYGPAVDTPSLLRQLADKTGQHQDYADEPWFTLWSSLCHQGDVYSASYAATPHIVQIALSAQGPIDFGFLQLPVCIEVARKNGRGSEVPGFLAKGYEQAIALLPECVNAQQVYDWSRDMAVCAAAALAVSKGHHELADAIINLDDNWIAKIIAVELTEARPLRLKAFPRSSRRTPAPP
jgi:hypothetical protein